MPGAPEEAVRWPSAALVAIVALAFALALAAADDAPAPPKKPKTTREIVLYGQAFPADLVLLVDASGSMKGAPYRLAVREALRDLLPGGDALGLQELAA